MWNTSSCHGSFEFSFWPFHKVPPLPYQTCSLCLTTCVRYLLTYLKRPISDMFHSHLLWFHCCIVMYSPLILESKSLVQYRVNVHVNTIVKACKVNLLRYINLLHVTTESSDKQQIHTTDWVQYLPVQMQCVHNINKVAKNSSIQPQYFSTTVCLFTYILTNGPNRLVWLVSIKL